MSQEQRLAERRAFLAMFHRGRPKAESEQLRVLDAELKKVTEALANAQNSVAIIAKALDPSTS
jgi:hypothetical protein